MDIYTANIVLLVVAEKSPNGPKYVQAWDIYKGMGVKYLKGGNLNKMSQWRNFHPPYTILNMT